MKHYCFLLEYIYQQILKKLAFNLKSGSNLLLITNGGTKGTILPLNLHAV